MFCIKINSSSFLILTTLIFAILLLSQSTGSAAASGNDAVLGFHRSLVEGNNSGGNSTALVLLAKERTRRKDPIDGFKYYTGGWDIKNEHYLASVLFTGFTPFLVGALWFFGFGIFLLLVCMYFCCCRHKRYGYSRFAYALSLILLSLFTIAAIVGSYVLYSGERNFNDSTKNTLDYVLLQAHSTAGNLKNFSNYLTAAKTIKVDRLSLSQDMQNNITNVSTLISTAADILESVTYKNRDNMHHIFDKLGLFLVIPAAIMVALAVLGFLLSVMGLQCLIYTLVIVGWILVAVTFILCGIFLVLHNSVGDTCVAMNEWVENPNANTTLGDIIPCVDPATAQEALNQSKEVTFRMAQLVNTIITNISNQNPPPNAPMVPPLSYNQSGPLVPYLCNPYNPDKTDRICVTGEKKYSARNWSSKRQFCPHIWRGVIVVAGDEWSFVNISAREVTLCNFLKVWRNYECQSSDGICTTEGRLTPAMYGTMNGAVNVSYGLHNFAPFFVNLTDCTFVRDTLTKIHDYHCPGLRKYTYWVYIGLAMVSVAVMLSLILWVVYARERRHRKYTKLVDATSGAGFTCKRP